VQGFAALPGATESMMVLRGVFPEGTKSRPQPMEPEARQGGGGGAASGGARRGAAAPLSDRDKEFLKTAFDEYLKPYLRS
jgi:hypothetical protein